MSTRKSSSEVDVFQGPSTQDLGEEREEGVVYHITLKRVRYGSQSTDSPTSHLRWVSEKVRSIRAGTLEKLVEGLAPEPGVMEVSQVYRTCFLSTYRCFADTGKVVDLLINRYSSMTEDAKEDAKQRQNKATIKKDILTFLRLWLDTYPQDFFAHPLSNTNLTKLRHLVQESHDLTRTLASLEEEEEEKEVERKVKVISNGHNGVTILDGDEEKEEGEEEEEDWRSLSPLFGMTSQEFATALTSEDARLFQQVSPPQCLDYIRRPKDTSNAPTLRACIEHFNKVSLVVISTILGGVTPDARAYMVKQWLDIAQHCRGVKNFSSMKAIVSGLQSTPVFRLKKTWEHVSSSKLQLFEELSGLLSADDNHQISRDLLNREGTAKYADVQSKKKGKRQEKMQSLVGVVPYLGTFLTDLTMIHTAYPDKTEDGLINFEKFRKQFELLAQLTLYQKSAANYCYDANQHLLRWLRHTHTSSPSDSYILSKELEPDPSPPHTGRSYTLCIPDIVTPSMPTSPSKKRRHQILQILGVKGSAVGDYTPMHYTRSANSSPSHTSSSSLRISTNLTTSISANDLTKLDYSSSKNSTVPRSISVTPTGSRRRTSVPEFFREGVGGRIVRVAVENKNYCMYKSLLVGPADKGHYIIQQSLEKHGVTEDHNQFELFQITKGKKSLQIPRNGNVFYALDTCEAAQPITILLSPKLSIQK